MHTAPLALTLALVIFWLVLGWGVQAVIKPRLAALTSLLLSPLIGFSATVLPAFWLNLVGLPVARFAWPLAVALAAIAVAGWAVKRPDWTRRHLIALAVIILAVLASGIPSLVFGFDWVANSNDDWGNYNLGALRFMEHGLLDRPSIETLQSGTDYPSFFYFLIVVHDSRSASELILAWIAVLTRQSPFFIFMPVILAFEALMLCAAATLALRGARSPLHWFLGLLLTVAAPLTLYAVQQQLIAQNLGLAFTCAMAALTCTRLSELIAWRRLVLVVIVAGAYLLSYPEMVPFFGLAFLAFHLAHIRDREWGWARIWRVLLIPVGLAIATGPYVLGAALFLLEQLALSGTQGRFGGVSIFPYFLVPSGAAMLLGFLPFGLFAPEPWLSIAIAAALALIALALITAVFRLKAGSVTSALLVILTLAAVQLALKHNDFGLFKVAMFVQPFLWFTLLSAIPGRRYLPLLVTGLLGSALLYTDFRMTAISVRDEAGGGIGLAGASRTHFLHDILDPARTEQCDVAFETANLPLIKILAARPGCKRLFTARFSTAFVVFEHDHWLGRDPLHQLAGIDDFARFAGSKLEPKLSKMYFKRPDGSDLPVDYFNGPTVDTARVGLPTNDESVLNRPQPTFLPIVNRQADEVHLEFIESSLGDHYYVPYFGITGMYATEPDPYARQRLIQAVGRYMLFQVIEPTPEVRLALDISTTVIAGGPRRLPPAVVMGATSASFGLVGNGTARVLSPPVKPLLVDGKAYVLLDLGKDAKQLETPRTGAMALYGAGYSVDYRVVTAFARRISVVDAEHCECNAAPAAITDLKAAMGDPTLRYSGIYEDGWIGQDGFARLAADESGRAVLTAMMPSGIGIDQTTVTLSVDGGPSVTRSLKPGDFKIAVSVGPGPHRISWHFGGGGVLPNGDDRGVAAKMQSLVIIPDADPKRDPVQSSTSDVDAIIGDTTRSYAGIATDGWLDKDGSIGVEAEKAGNVVFHVSVPEKIGLGTYDTVTMTVDGGGEVTRPVTPGDTVVEIPVAVGRHEVSWHFSATSVLPNGDGRTVAALLKSVSVIYDTSDAKGASAVDVR